MQTTGYLDVNNEITLVLVRQNKYSRSMKLRKSGKVGVFLEDESYSLEIDHPELMKKLKQGETISL